MGRPPVIIFNTLSEPLGEILVGLFSRGAILV